MKNHILKMMLLIILVFSIVGCGGSSSDDGDIESNSNTIINDDASNDGASNDDASGIAYFIKKDENNKIVMEKAENGDFIVTEMKNGKYATTKILASGDTNVFEIAYQDDGVQLTYKDETEFVATDETEFVATDETVKEQEIESQYIGIWREDVDENWEGAIDIAYIYTDKAIVFTANISTDACSQVRTLNVSEFQSLLKNDIDVDDYLIATTYKSRIETACGSYASLTSSVRNTRNFIDWFKTPKEERDEDLESKMNDFLYFSQNTLDSLFGAQVAGFLMDNIEAKIKSKENWWVLEGILSFFDKLKALHKLIVSISGDTEDITNSIYDRISNKNNNNDIIGIKNDIEDFEDDSYIDSGSPYEDSNFMYTKKDENEEIKVTKYISYDSNNRKVEETPNYDENGEIISVTKKTYLGDDAFGAAYEVETVKVDNNPKDNNENGGSISSEDGDSSLCGGFVGYWTGSNGTTLNVDSSCSGVIIQNATNNADVIKTYLSNIYGDGSTMGYTMDKMVCCNETQVSGNSYSGLAYSVSGNTLVWGNTYTK